MIVIKRKSYQWCVVPRCRNNSIRTPSKLFVNVPRKTGVRKKWFQLANRKCESKFANCNIYFCEDHFNLPNDMRYGLMGYVDKMMLKPGCLPSKFKCQSDEKSRTIIKKKTSAAVQKTEKHVNTESDSNSAQETKQEDLQEQVKVDNETGIETTTFFLNIKTEVKLENQTKSGCECDSEQTLVKSAQSGNNSVKSQRLQSGNNDEQNLKTEHLDRNLIPPKFTIVHLKIQIHTNAIERYFDG